VPPAINSWPPLTGRPGSELEADATVASLSLDELLEAVGERVRREMTQAPPGGAAVGAVE